jgi:phage terminase Nu1 subunit (DNA packaging protein)
MANHGHLAPWFLPEFLQASQEVALSLVLSSASGPVLNKAELAHALKVSLPTLSRWQLRYADFPVLERGTNGRDYKFDAAAVFAFLRARQEEQEAANAEKDEQLSQLLLPFEIAAETAPASRLSPKEELEALKLAEKKLEIAVRAGQLVAVAEVANAVETVLRRLSSDMHAFLRQVGREQQWPDGYMRAVDARLTERQRASVKDLEAILGGEEAGHHVA